jgi:hypothetical protein
MGFAVERRAEASAEIAVLKYQQVMKCHQHFVGICEKA